MCLCTWRVRCHDWTELSLPLFLLADRRRFLDGIPVLVELEDRVGRSFDIDSLDSLATVADVVAMISDTSLVTRPRG